jgi:tetraacyldisaccharide 4'-kinase
MSAASIVPAPHELKARPVIAFAGLGRPAKFRETLEGEGVTVIEFHPFGDHHAYTAQELGRLLVASRKCRAMLVTTEKDFVRLPENFRQHVTMLPITLQFDDPSLPATLIRKAMAR